MCSPQRTLRGAVTTIPGCTIDARLYHSLAVVCPWQARLGDKMQREMEKEQKEAERNAARKQAAQPKKKK